MSMGNLPDFLLAFCYALQYNVTVRVFRGPVYDTLCRPELLSGIPSVFVLG